MANANPIRIGQVNSAGDPKALFLKMYAGEVITAFAEKNIAQSRTMVRNITAGRSAQFPVLGKGGAQYHTPGTEITGSLVPGNERVIEVDDLLIAPRFIANIDEAMSHFEVRSEYSKDAGRELAKTFDKNVLQVIALAARASASVSGASGGSRIVGATVKTSADAFVQACFDAQTALDQKDVPKEDRFLAVDPAMYYKLINSSSKAVDRDFNPAGNGGVGEGVIYRVAGLPIVTTNNLPSTNVATGPTAYQGDFSATAGLVWHRAAVGTVKLLDLALEMEYDIRRQGTLIVAKYAVGHGILRPDCAVEIATA